MHVQHTLRTMINIASMDAFSLALLRKAQRDLMVQFFKQQGY